MIRKSQAADFDRILEIINDGASAYKGVIPDDRWHEPYMSRQELEAQQAEGVIFYCYADQDTINGVMGIQDKGEIALIRHAYVRTKVHKHGIGSQLLVFLLQQTQKPVLIGTWQAASWAIAFYQKHGFKLVSETDKNRLLPQYWKIPPRQIECSVVLADATFFS